MGVLITLQGHNIAKDYVNILADQVYPMVQFLLSNDNVVFQDDKAPVHSPPIVQD